MRKVALISAQFADLPLEDLCGKLRERGYSGIELACLGDHFHVREAAASKEYCDRKRELLNQYGLECKVIAGHLIGQCVGDLYDPRLDNFAPPELAGNGPAIREWAIEEMKLLAKAAANMGVSVVSFFTGSPIWRYIYSFPQATVEMIEEGYDEILRLWSPIMDEYDKYNVRLALEVHPTEIAFDYYSTAKLFEKFQHRETLGLTFDPSHLLWQGVNPVVFLRDFMDRVYNVHMKDVKLSHDGKAGILGSHIEFGDTRRGWNFISLGHGDVDFGSIIRELNQAEYSGNISIEWEDSGMDRFYGAEDAINYLKKFNFPTSNVAFDKALSSSV
ncbi:MAG: xylose isomerase domain protein barrel [Bacillota bacterium]|nr:xylose isomerase domain protein barrel [Bacillota bacterium]